METSSVLLILNNRISVGGVSHSCSSDIKLSHYFHRAIPVVIRRGGGGRLLLTGEREHSFVPAAHIVQNSVAILAYLVKRGSIHLLPIL